MNSIILSILILLLSYIICTLSGLLFKIKPKFYYRILFYVILILTSLLLFSSKNLDALSNILLLILFITYIYICEISAELIYKFYYLKRRIKKEEKNI